MPVLNIDDTAPDREVIRKQLGEDDIKELVPDPSDINKVKEVRYSDDVVLDETRKFRTHEDNQMSILLNKNVPLETIMKYPRGMKWEVDYFLQIRDINDEVGQPDINLSPTIQKYNRINKLILVLQSAIQQDTPESLSGEAIINAGFLPNAGDAFIARVAGGREVIFTIEEVQTRSYNVHRAYYVTFKSFAFGDSSPEYVNTLIRKTMREYVYDRNYLLDFSAPVILKQDFKNKLSLKEIFEDMKEYYFDTFLNTEKNVIAVPTTSSVYVDTMLNHFLLKIVNVTEEPKLYRVNFMPLDDTKERLFTIWDVIVKRNTKLLKRAEKNISFIYRPYSINQIASRNMNYLNINFFASKVDTFRLPTCLKHIELERPTDYQPPIDPDNRRYVLSEHFYKQDFGNLSPIEKALWDWLEGKVVPFDEVQALIDAYPYWDTIDQYYLLPVLFVLIKDSIINTFRSL